MSAAPCTVEGCDKPRLARELCDSHYRKLRKHGTPTYVRPQVSDLECDVDGCTDRRAKRTWCGKHYLRWYNHGNPTHEPTRHDECTVEGCESEPRTSTSPHCEKHYYRIRRTGGTEVTSTRRAHSSYRAAHSRIARDRGPAASHPCVDCGGTAEHWSYTHGDPAELVSRTGQPYSMDVTNYEPRCRRCHAVFDGTGRNQYS